MLLVLSVWVRACLFVFDSTCAQKRNAVFSLQPLEYTSYRSSSSRASSRASSARASPVVSLHSQTPCYQPWALNSISPLVMVLCNHTRLWLNLPATMHLYYNIWFMIHCLTLEELSPCSFWVLEWFRLGMVCRIWKCKHLFCVQSTSTYFLVNLYSTVVTVCSCFVLMLVSHELKLREALNSL